MHEVDPWINAALGAFTLATASVLNVRFCVYAWLSLDGCELRSALLQTGAEHSSLSIVRHRMSF